MTGNHIKFTPIAKVISCIIAAPIFLVLLIAVALYLPPVQKWAVDKACEYASEETGMEVTIEGVHLAFPLDLSVEGILCIAQNDSLPQQKDTIADIRKAIVDVQLIPLFSSDVVINAIELNQAHMNTSNLIHEARIKGYVGRMMIDNVPPPVARVNIDSSVVRLSSVILADSRINVELSDTVPEDTSKTENLWKIYVRDINICNTDVAVHMPGDTLQVKASLKDAKAQEGFFDLNRGLYQMSHLALSHSTLAYDNNFERHTMKGFDANHIGISDLNICVDSIYFCNPEVRMRVRSASMKEKSGLTLSSMNADIALDSTQMKINGNMSTPESRMALNFIMKPSPMEKVDLNNGTIDARFNASIGRGDLMTFALADLPNKLKSNWPLHPLNIKGEMHGNLNEVTLPWMTVEIPTAFSINAQGKVRGFMNLAKDMYSRLFNAQIHADMKTYNMGFVKSMMDRSTARMINIPAMRAVADITANGPDYTINLRADEGRGTMTAKGKVNIAAMSYAMDVKAQGLNLGHFVKGYGLGVFSGDISANGTGTDIYSPHTRTSIKADVRQLYYGSYNLSNMNAEATMTAGRLDMKLDAHNQLINGNFTINGNIGNRKQADITVTSDMHNIDLYHLGITDKPLTVGVCGHLDVATDMKDYYRVEGMVSDIYITDTTKTYHPDDITIDLLTRKDTMTAKVDCGDFALRMNASHGYKWLMGCSDRMQNELKKQFAERTIDQKKLRDLFPNMTLSLHSGRNNPIYRFVKMFNMDYSLIDVNMETSKQNGIFGDLTLQGLETQGVKLDTITASLKSSNDPYGIFYNGHIQNIPPNDIVFDAFFDGNIMEHGLDLNAKIYDEANELALKLGAEATMEENGIKLHLNPKRPVLGYEEFTLNDDNYILLGSNNRIHADVNLLADDGTGLKVYCTDNDGDINDEESDMMQDLTLSLNKLNLGKIVASIPYAPNVKGLLNGDFHIMQNKDKSLVLASDLTVHNMVYEGCNIGNIGSEFTYLPKEDGSHYIDGIITMDGEQVGTMTGSYDSKYDAIDATMTFENFPMHVINGFVPDQLIGLEGKAEGELSIHGTTRSPDVNGELFLQDAALLSIPYGVRLRFDDDPVRIQNSKLLLENFQMYAPNNEPLLAYGSVDFHDTDHIMMDLRMRAKNFQLIDARETRYSEAYGSMYVNFFAFIKGELDKLQVRGKLDILPTTNLFYILRDSPITTDNRLKELVTFTDLSSGEKVSIKRPAVDGMVMNMDITVNEGAQVKCWLNTDHSNYIDIIGEGNLRMTYEKEQMNLNGRYTISQGEMKYSMPVIPLKTFTIANGSYLEWFGDIMNPRLNITATENMKSAVNVNGVNQMVTFNTGVVLSKTLQDMGLEFIVDAPENQNVSDELNMRSNEERGKLAVTLLTTGMYLTDGNTENFSMNSALNSFLQSEINNIAGNALKTIDLSFGMESSTEQDGTMHNDYTFKFAKRFWNNRLSISVGGKISSGPDVSGQNKSFFNNVELQYRLSEASNKYLQMYYKRAVYDYLEGYLGQYGAGYLWKKKAQTFKGIFTNETITMPRTQQPARTIGTQQPTRTIGTQQPVRTIGTQQMAKPDSTILKP